MPAFMKLELSISPVLAVGAMQPALQRWAIGQMMSATIIGRDSVNSTLVEIDGQQFRAETGITLTPGTRLPVRVAHLGDTPVLEIQLRPESVESEPVRTSALRELLPRQIPQAQGLQELMTLVTRLAGRDGVIGAAGLVDGVQALIANLPELGTLAEPRALRGALAQAGTRLERELAGIVDAGSHRPTLPAADFKWQLLALRAQLDGAPGDAASARSAARPGQSGSQGLVLPTVPTPDSFRSEPAVADERRNSPSLLGAPTVRNDVPPAPMQHLHQQFVESVDGMLARLTSLQLQMAEAAANGAPLGLFEIPVRLQETPQSLLLKVEGGGGGTDSVTDSLLAVTIAVPVTPTEEMLVRMTMQADTLQIAMWSDAEPLRHAIEVRYGELRAKLEQDGFRVAGIKVTPLALRRDVPYQPKGLIRTSV